VGGVGYSTHRNRGRGVIGEGKSKSTYPLPGEDGRRGRQPQPGSKNYRRKGAFGFRGENYGRGI